MEFVFNKKLKNVFFGLMAIGIIAILTGFFTDHSDHHNRFWSNVLINSFFFLAIGLGALFFYALQYATETAWSAVTKRVFEAIYASIPAFSVTLLLVLVVGSMGGHHVYHWMDANLLQPFLEDGKTANPEYDHIIAGKSAYLNIPFFLIRTVVYLVAFIMFAKWFRTKSLLEDQIGGTDLHFAMYKRAPIFLAVFAVFSSTASWDWLMSVDPHWFSTLYGWYIFSGMWVTAMIMAVCVITFLRGKGLMTEVNENHMHDLNKWMFALSFLWTYLWFSQFMLIWYSDIPEEVTYYMERMNDQFRVPFFIMFGINFIFPMIMLMGRSAKRKIYLPIVIGSLIFIGHWLDVYMLVTPGATHHFHIGFMEVGMFLGFLGLFLYITFNALSKAALVAVNHPFYEESKHTHI